MGIKNLLKFLYNFPNIIKVKNISEYKGKKIAIDISILLYQSVIAMRQSGYDIKNKDNMVISHVIGLLNKTLLLLEYGLIPVYVFDGKPPALKKKVLNTRRDNKTKALAMYNNANTEQERIRYFKRCVTITREQMDDCRELLDLMGIPYINAVEEADSELAYLCKHNLVHAVFTEDMDILTFGAPKIIKNVLSYNKPLIEINLIDILDNLHITYEEFVELCIYFGCDYCPISNNITNMDIYKSYINKNMKDTLMQNEEYINAKDYFINSTAYKKDYVLNLQEPQYDKLCNILVTKYHLSINKTNYKLTKLANCLKN